MSDLHTAGRSLILVTPARTISFIGAWPKTFWRFDLVGCPFRGPFSSLHSLTTTLQGFVSSLSPTFSNAQIAIVPRRYRSLLRCSLPQTLLESTVAVEAGHLTHRCRKLTIVAGGPAIAARVASAAEFAETLSFTGAAMVERALRSLQS